MSEVCKDLHVRFLLKAVHATFLVFDKQLIQKIWQQHMRKEGIHFGLSHSGRILLADEMGLGKTLQALVPWLKA